MVDFTTSLGRPLWKVKARLSRLPGAYKAYQWFKQSHGQGRVYQLRFGPMRGLRWKRYNSLPYWYHLGLWEPDVSELIASHLRPGDTFWDVGANAGYHTIMAARVVGPTGRVVAIEPDPAVAAILREEIALNGFDNCVVVEAAVGDTEGRVTLRRLPNNLMNALDAVGVEGEPYDVDGVTFDGLLERFGPPSLLKVDIEGAERFALPKATRLLDEVRARWLLSTHGEDVKAWCWETLRTHGYEVTNPPEFGQLLVAIPAP